MSGPNVIRATATARDAVVRVAFAFPIGLSGEWGWSATLSPAVARELATQLVAAADAVYAATDAVTAEPKSG